MKPKLVFQQNANQQAQGRVAYQNIKKSFFTLNHACREFIIEIIVFFMIANLNASLFQLFKQQTAYLEPSQCPLVQLVENRALFVLLWHLNSLTDIVKTMQWRISTTSLTQSILTNIACLLLPMLPSVGLHIVKVNIFARIGSIAPDCVRIEKAFVYLNVLQSDVPQGDSGLGLAGSLLIERIKHATRTISIRLLHLLGTDVDCPPNWAVHCEVAVVNVLDQSCPFISWICFDVDSFQRSHHPNIPKRNVFDTIAVSFRRHTSDSHPHPQKHCTILDQEIPCTISLKLRLWNHNIIIVLASDVIDMEPSSRRINSISIEREHDD